jgi:hypothetical protein
MAIVVLQSSECFGSGFGLTGQIHNETAMAIDEFPKHGNLP